MFTNPPPEADCRAIFDRERSKHRDWPATFEQAMRDPLLSRIIMLAAKHRATAPAPRQRPASAPRQYSMQDTGAEPATPLSRPAARPMVEEPARRRRPPLDFKSLAAGEREDDEAS